MYVIKCITMGDYLQSMIKNEEGQFDIYWTDKIQDAFEYINRKEAEQVLAGLLEMELFEYSIIKLEN